MTATPPEETGRRPLRRPLRWLSLILLILGAAWLASWFVQRSLRANHRKRAVQAWLDDRLNADVALTGSMSVRFNPARYSRLAFNNLEVENPNAVFPGKFVVAGRLEASVPPWALAGLWPGQLSLEMRDFRVAAEENESGEWNLAGLMDPIPTEREPAAFPFPVPAISAWRIGLTQGRLSIRRRGYDLELGLDGEASGRPEGGRIGLKLTRNRFSFGRADAGGGRAAGRFGPAQAVFAAPDPENGRPLPALEQIRTEIEDLPISLLPFLFAGLPLEAASGFFSGTLSCQPLPGALAIVNVEGELRDAPLAAFGLPRRAPIRLSWPVFPAAPGLRAEIRLGPQGFGAFEMDLPLDPAGRPARLSLRGDVASLDDLAALFARRADWPEWMAQTFPAVEWVSRNWLGFGWSGKELRLSLSRSAVGLRLSGEAGLAGGRVRLETTPDRPDLPANAASEEVDAVQLAETLNALLPEPFRVKLTGGKASFNCRGLLGDNGGLLAWGAGLVFTSPVIRTAESGSWWGGLLAVADGVAKALPDWGGGDPGGLLGLTTPPTLNPRQLSIVCDRDSRGELGLEFRSHGDGFGQADGALSRDDDGGYSGVMFLFGESALIREAERANPELGLMLSTLANGPDGLAVEFRIPAGGEPEFSFPFLREALALRDSLREPEAGE